jgi:hypothetical protein
MPSLKPAMAQSACTDFEFTLVFVALLFKLTSHVQISRILEKNCIQQVCLEMPLPRSFAALPSSIAL